MPSPSSSSSPRLVEQQELEKQLQEHFTKGIQEREAQQVRHQKIHFEMQDGKE